MLLRWNNPDYSANTRTTVKKIYIFQDEASGNDYGHRENKALDDVTHGEYFVRLPDGRLQTVTYYVDPKSGFRATVAYDREVAAPSNQPPLQVTGKYVFFSTRGFL